MLDNVPEFVFWLEAAALAGAVVVGANPTHRGDELARDLAHTECQFLVTDSTNLPLVEGARIGDSLGDVGRDNERVLVLDTKPAQRALDQHAGTDPLDVADRTVTPESLGYLLFTSGTSGAPKACLCSQGRLARIGAIVAQMYALTPEDVCYLSMPLFHSNALMAGWGPALMAGSAFALPSTGRFSASGFLPDVRAAGATYFNYVGKPLSYILATPERPDDADNPLVRAFGNEGSADDVARFAERFGLAVTDSYGSTEGGATVQRTPDTPPGALGRAPEGTVVLDPATGEECPPARFDERGRLLNAEEADRRARLQGRRRRVRGLLAQRRCRACPAARGLVLDRRPRLSRRGRLLLLRRTRPRLAARGRRELRVGPGRADPAAASRRGARRCLRRARPGRWATRSWRPCSCGPVSIRSIRRAWPSSWPPRGTSARSGRRASCA